MLQLRKDLLAAVVNVADPRRIYAGLNRTRHNETIANRLGHGAAQNIKNNRGRTALHYASGAPAEGPTSVDPSKIRLLLTHGADPNIPDKNAVAPLVWVLSRGNLSDHIKIEAAQMLLKAGATPPKSLNPVPIPEIQKLLSEYASKNGTHEERKEHE